MSIIRKHPIAFWAMVGFLMAGISSVPIFSEQEYSALLAISTIVFLTGCAIVIVSAIAGIIWAVKKSTGSSDRKNGDGWYENELACEYMQKTAFGSIYWIAVILLSPFIPLLLVHVLDVYMFSVMFIGLGLLIFMVTAHKDIFAAKFFRQHNTGLLFRMQSGDDRQLIDSLYGHCVHGYLKGSWDEYTQDFIYNLLLREKGLSGDIQCYTVSADFLSQQYGCYRSPAIDGYVMVPLSQFRLSRKNGQKIKHYLDWLASTNLNSTLNARYGTKRSLTPGDYENKVQGIRLRPSASDVTGAGRFGNDVRIALSMACDSDCTCKLFYNCLLVLKNAQLTDNAAMSDIETRLFSAETCWINSHKLNYEDNTLELTIVIDDDIDAEDWELPEEEYSPEHQLIYRFDDLEWYYDGFCDTRPMQALLEQIKPESAN